jgi:hypothetical protein
MRLSSALFVLGACRPLLPAQAEERAPVAVKLSGAPGPYTVERWKHDWQGCEWEDGCGAEFGGLRYSVER